MPSEDESMDVEVVDITNEPSTSSKSEKIKSGHLPWLVFSK